MFAASSSSRIYHLADPALDRTVCGLSVRRICVPEPDSASYCLVENLPADYSLCAHCTRLGSIDRKIGLEQGRAS